jgi:hypothetical protein
MYHRTQSHAVLSKQASRSPTGHPTGDHLIDALGSEERWWVDDTPIVPWVIIVIDDDATIDPTGGRICQPNQEKEVSCYVGGHHEDQGRAP